MKLMGPCLGCRGVVPAILAISSYISLRLSASLRHRRVVDDLTDPICNMQAYSLHSRSEPWTSMGCGDSGNRVAMTGRFFPCFRMFMSSGRVLSPGVEAPSPDTA